LPERAPLPAAPLVRELTAAPGLVDWVIVKTPLKDLAPLNDPLWLVVDDVHELGPEPLGQLELRILQAPPELGFVLATWHDVRLGLRRARLEGELAEIREPDLQFTQTGPRLAATRQGP
jgi:LuxR family maltose regulon positive regulatory protein